MRRQPAGQTAELSREDAKAAKEKFRFKSLTPFGMTHLVISSEARNLFSVPHLASWRESICVPEKYQTSRKFVHAAKRFSYDTALRFFSKSSLPRCANSPIRKPILG
jgi:hypothetical protein